MKIINCPLCKSKEYVFFCKKEYSHAEYNIVRCNNCGFFYTNPEPNQKEILELYNQSYLDNHLDVWHQFEDKLNQAITRILVKENVKSNLDLGSGQGRFVSMLKKHRIESVGVEPIEDSCRIAKDKYGIELHNITSEQYLLNCNQKYDSITMLNVLEHLSNPCYIITLIKKCLVKNGNLILVVPNVDFTLFLGFIRQILGFNDKYMLSSKKFSQQGFDPPIHLSAFSKKTLKKILTDNNFKVQKITNAPVIKSSSSIMNISKKSVSLIGKVLELLTLDKVVFGYSLLSIAKNE